MTEADSETVTAEGSTCAAVSFPGSGFMEAFAHRYSLSILETLLCDRTTGRNIIWADNEYEALGDGYMGDDEITIEKITGPNVNVIRPRIAKAVEQQSLRTKSRAEVFSPAWLCNQMNNDLDEVWFGRRDVFNTETVAEDGANTWVSTNEPIAFPKSKGHGWHAYVEAPRLEITCGEAPFVCSRYDAVTGGELPVSERVGFLDRKLRVVTEKTKTRKEWVRRASMRCVRRMALSIRATISSLRVLTCSRRLPSISATDGDRISSKMSLSRRPGSYPGTSGK